LRRADGTYREKTIQRYDFAKPPVEYESAGHWKIAGRSYTLTLERVTTPIWKPNIGKKWTMDILAMNADLFQYLSSDGARVEERRIGEASESAFDKLQPKPL
jgi:hypothetical protein